MSDIKKKHWLTSKKNIKKLWIIMISVLISTILIQLLLPIHGHFDIEESVAFAAWFGFLCCVLMILVAKLLGFLVKRQEKYYSDLQKNRY